MVLLSETCAVKSAMIVMPFSGVLNLDFLASALSFFRCIIPAKFLLKKFKTPGMPQTLSFSCSDFIDVKSFII